MKTHYASCFRALLAGSALLLSLGPAKADLSAGLVGHWELAGNVLDSSPYGNNGTVYGSLSYVPDGPLGLCGDFDPAGTAYVEIPHEPQYVFTSSFSVSLWWKPYSFPNSGRVIQSQWPISNTEGNGWEICYDFYDTNLWFWYASIPSDPGWSEPVCPIPTIAGRWHHIVYTYSSTENLFSGYLNGSLVGSQAPQRSPLPMNTTLPILLMHDRAQYKDADGLLAAVRIYNRALSAAEVQQLYGMPSDISGRVLNSAGQPIAGASVQIGSNSATSGSDGSYSITSLSVGNYPVTVSAAGYTTLTTSMTVPGSGAISQNFTLSPASATSSGTRPVVTSLTTTYSPNGEALYFLDGVTFPVVFTASVDWAGHAPGSVLFITTRGGATSVPATGNTASQQIDVGSAFGPGGQLQVQAVSIDGTFSIATVATFVVMSQLPAQFSDLFEAVDEGTTFYYNSRSSAALQLLEDQLEMFYLDDVPLLGSTLATFDLQLSVNATVRGPIAQFQTATVVGPLTDLGSLIFSLATADPDELDFEFPAQITLDTGDTGYYDAGAQQWNWNVNLQIAGDVSKTVSFPLALIEAILLPSGSTMIIPSLSGEATVDAKIDRKMNITSLYPTANNGELDVSLTISGGVVDEVFGITIIDFISGGGTLTAQGAVSSGSISLSEGEECFLYSYILANRINTWTWPNQTASLDGVSVPSSRKPSSPQPYPRNYLQSASYAAFHRYGVKPIAKPLSLTAASTTDNPSLYALQSDVFPFSEPSISAEGTNCYAVWLYDNTNRTANNRTMLVFSQFNGTNWSKFSPVADDGTADFHPQLRTFTDGSAVVAWENETTVLPTNADFTAIITNLEIATAFYDPVAGTWQPQQQLTANGYLDRTPRIAGPSVNNLMLVWVANTNNDVEGSATSVNQLCFATWNGSTWSAPQAFANVPYPLLKYDMSYDGTNSYVVMTLHADNTLTNVNAHELFEVAYQNGSWGGLQQLTTNQVPNDNPQMAIDPNGHIVLVWLQGDTLASVVDFNFANQRVAATNEYSSNLADFRLASSSSDGRLAIVWAAPSPQYSSDLWGMFYDPNFEVWGSPHQLTADPETEMETAATFYGTNQLIALYDRLDLAIGDTNQIGSVITNADLYVLQYVLTNDLALVANSLTVSPANPAPGDTATLSVMAENLGDSAVSNVLVAFFQGDPANGGAEIGQTNIAVLMPPGASDVVSIPWTVPATTNPLSIYAVIDPYQQYPQSDLQDEEVNNFFVEPDLALQSLAWGQITSNLLSVTATVINEGTIASQPATVSFTLNLLTGTNLFSTGIVSLAPGQSVDVNFIWNVPSLGSGLRLFAAVNTGTNADFNPHNNALQMTIEPNITSVNVQFGPITVLSNGAVQVSMTGLAGQTYLIEVSTNQVDWSTSTEVTLTNGVGQFLDTSTNNFYQAVMLSQAEPQLGAPQLLNGAAQISVTGLTGQTYVIEGSTDLVNWVPIYTNGSSFMFTDPSATNYQQRFYRALIP
ncbi:MAG: LamG-like jellyroll fold domain-containing protein [Limisphaerales bacterium]